MGLEVFSYQDLRGAGYPGKPPKPYSIIRVDGSIYQILVYDATLPRILVREMDSETILVDRWRHTAYGNGFPKAGTMMLGQILASCHMPYSVRERGPSTHIMGWSSKLHPIGSQLAKFRRMKVGQYASGHVTAADRSIMGWLENHGIPVIFIYRDLRDVAVSYAHHVEASDQKKLFHPDPKPWRELPSHEDRIEKFISGGISDWVGLGPFWEQYRGWLYKDWVHCIKYEDVILEPRKTCEGIYRYLCDVRGEVYSDEEFETFGTWLSLSMVREKSVTFRKGKIGEYRKEFTPELMKLSDELLGGYLEEMGYE